MYAVQRLLIEIFCVFLLRIRKCSTAAFLLGNWSIFERLKNMMSEVISIFSGVQIEHCLYKPFQCQTNLLVPIYTCMQQLNDYSDGSDPNPCIVWFSVHKLINYISRLDFGDFLNTTCWYIYTSFSVNIMQDVCAIPITLFIRWWHFSSHFQWGWSWSWHASPWCVRLYTNPQLDDSSFLLMSHAWFTNHNPPLL